MSKETMTEHLAQREQSNHTTANSVDQPPALEYETTVAFAWFVRIYRRVNADQTRFLASEGITPAQYGLMAVLLQEDGLSFTELKKRTAVQGSTLTGLVDRLETKALVTRSVHTRDRRQIKVNLTDKGIELLRTASPADPNGVLYRALATIPPERRTALLDTLASLGRQMGDEDYGDIVPILFRLRAEE